MYKNFILITGNNESAITHRTNVVLKNIINSIGNKYIIDKINFKDFDKNIEDMLFNIECFIKQDSLFNESKIILCNNFYIENKKYNSDIVKTIFTVTEKILKLFNFILDNKNFCNDYIIFSGSIFIKIKKFVEFFNKYGCVMNLTAINNKDKIDKKLKFIYEYFNFLNLNINNIPSGILETIAKNLDFESINNIYNEIDKFILYTDEFNNNFDANIVKSIIDIKNVNIFDFLDSLFSKELEKSLYMFNLMIKFYNENPTDNVSFQNRELFILSNIASRAIKIFRFFIFCEANDVKYTNYINSYYKFNALLNSKDLNIDYLDVYSQHPYALFHLLKYHKVFNKLEILNIIKYIFKIYDDIIFFNNKIILIEKLIIKICS